MLNRGASDESALINSFNSAHDKKSASYEKSRFHTDGKFTIKHFAGAKFIKIYIYLTYMNI